MAEGEYEVGECTARSLAKLRLNVLWSNPESILRAKVEAKPRGRKAWLYWVKWKNYDFKDNTWEPAQSFNGSKHFIELFWSRIDTKGRDYQNMRDFAINEEFFPSGPPRHKKTKKQKPHDEVEDISPTRPTREHDDSEKEVRSIIGGEEEERSMSTRGSKRRRSSIVAESEDAAPKRKRGRPPGIPASDLPRVQSSEGSSASTVRRTRSRANLQRDSSPPHAAAGAELSKSSPYRVPLPRTRERQAKDRQSSVSADELLLAPPREEKGKGRPRHGTKLDSEVMDVDEPTIDPPSPFGIPSLFESPLVLSEVPPPEAPSEEEPPVPALPAHRVRAANPRVKVTDDPHLTETTGGLAVKARFMKRAANTNGEAGSSTGAGTSRTGRISGSKAGPGRSSSGLIVGGSRLTAQKGKLVTVKPRKARRIEEPVQQEEKDGARVEIDIEEVLDVVVEAGLPTPPPTGQDLLNAAGMNSAAGELPDFEDDAEGDVDSEYATDRQHQPHEARADTNTHNAEITIIGDDTSNAEAPPAPAVILEARPVTFASRVSAAWNQSTIFGPLALGLSGVGVHIQSHHDSSNSSFESRRYTFYLNLDSAMSVPVTLKDVRAKQPFLDGLDSVARSPTGKFYQDNHAIDLVKTLCAQESFARVTLSEDSTDEQKQHFERFTSRMQAGELFIQMNHAQMLLMCGSDNSVVGQKLGVPAQLLGLGGAVVVAHVDIQNYSEYAEAALLADNARW